MGTRADFYIGRGADAEWLGSTAWDGYPEGITPKSGEWSDGKGIFTAATRDQFLIYLEEYFRGRDDVSRPKDGWPWPWDDSGLTDCVYALDEGKVWQERRGYWIGMDEEAPDEDEDESAFDRWLKTHRASTFPNMKDQQKVTFGKRSGIMVFGVE